MRYANTSPRSDPGIKIGELVLAAVERKVASNAEMQKLNLLHDFKAILQNCDSPIEELLLAALYVVSDCSDRYRFCGKTSPAHQHGPGTFVYQQSQVGPYRVDFLLVDTNLSSENPDRIVVECDGHNFHERTKEQARHDRARDRHMQADGFKVLRFTGSEIWADPAKCAAEICNHLSQDWIPAEERNLSEPSAPAINNDAPTWPAVIEAGALFRGAMLEMIAREPDQAEKKARIMIAREHGHLTDDESEDWIVLNGLETH